MRESRRNQARTQKRVHLRVMLPEIIRGEQRDCLRVIPHDDVQIAERFGERGYLRDPLRDFPQG